MENCTGWILNWLLDGDIINLYTTQQGSVGRPVAQTKTSTLFENMLMLTLAVAWDNGLLGMISYSFV